MTQDELFGNETTLGRLVPRRRFAPVLGVDHWTAAKLERTDSCFPPRVRKGDFAVDIALRKYRDALRAEGRA